jgi:hypothetical protein
MPGYPGIFYSLKPFVFQFSTKLFEEVEHYRFYLSH